MGAAQSNLAKTWIVDSHGSGDFTSIQAAINASSAGDTVYVKSGTYFEHPLVYKSISLIGQSKDSTIIDGQHQSRQLIVPNVVDPGCVVGVIANGVKISGFTIQGGQSAVWVKGYSYVTVSDNVIVNNGDGIRLLYSTGDTISGNIIRNNPDTSLGFDAITNTSVANNVIANNYIGVGAGIVSYNNTFSSNNVVGNSHGFYLAMYNSTFYNNAITNNSVQVAFYGDYHNSWDSSVSVGGNYWTMYRGTDLNGDGIGETPYSINPNNIDNYPFISQSSLNVPQLPTNPPTTMEPSNTPSVTNSFTTPQQTPGETAASATSPTSYPQYTNNPSSSSGALTQSNDKADNSQNLIILAVGLVVSLIVASSIFGIFIQHRKKPIVPVQPQVEQPVYEKCSDCGAELTPSVEYVTLTSRASAFGLLICKSCMIKRLDKQGSVCPQCKEPLRWNGNLKEFLSEWYHPKCAFELQNGKQVKEITREVLVKVRCPYCKTTYNESLDNCPNCGAPKK